jgi:two-component system, NtrC family, sensor histidine kinase HydH
LNFRRILPPTNLALGVLAIGLMVGTSGSVAALPHFYKSAQDAGRGTRQKRNSADLAASGASVVSGFLNSSKTADARIERHNRSMPFIGHVQTARLKGAGIALLVVLLAVFTWMVPPHAEVLHNVLHHLNFLPFMLAGMVFGWRGALKTILLATLLQFPSVYRHWFRAPLDAKDQLVELSIFGAAGVIAGVLADRERMQRARVEATKLELEHVHSELRENIEHLKKTERLTAAGQLSASLAHEIRNPLASISGAAGILGRRQASEETRAECLDILTKESLRLNKLLTNFLDFARPRLPKYQTTDLAEVLQSVTALAQHAASRAGMALQLQLPAVTSEIECDPEQIKQLLLNIILNAIEATEGDGVVVIRSFFEEEYLCVEVCDEGPGITREDTERIFDPFFTTKKNGTGLGLAIATNIAAQHSGSLTCRPNATRGTIFRMELPFAGQAATPLLKVAPQ